MAWLLDTNILSELKRSNPDRRVVALFNTWPLDDLYISTIMLAEIRFGIERQPDAGRRAELTRWLTGTIRPMFAGRVLEVTEDIVLRWRLLVEDGRKAGRTYSEPDLLIATTALEHGLTFVTRNVKDFAGIGLTILNPWD